MYQHNNIIIIIISSYQISLGEVYFTPELRTIFEALKRSDGSPSPWGFGILLILVEY